MIAIGNLKQPTIFGEDELDRFNLLNAIDGADRKFNIRHLPIYGEVPSKQKALTLNLSKVLSSKKNTNASDSFYSTSEKKPSDQFANYIESRKKVIESLDDPDSETPKSEGKVENDDDLATYTDDGKQIIYAKSMRDSELLKAKINNFLSSNDNSISPVMPISLTLKVYGNNFLGIGDYFSVNFLPKHYEERVYFQIVGVDHNIGTSMWDTTYTTVMRLRPNKIYKAFGNNKSDEIAVEVRFHPTLQKQIITELVGDIADGHMQNDAMSVMAVDVESLGTSTLTLGQDTAANRDDAAANNITYDDIPNISIVKTRFSLDPNKDPKKLKEMKKEGLNVFKDKVGYQVRHSVEITRGELAYWQSMSNLLLGPDVIDWKRAKDEGNEFSFYQRKIPTFAARGTLEIGDVKPGEIYIIPRIDGDNVYNNIDGDQFEVGENYGQFILSTIDQKGSSAGLDKAQIAVDNIVKSVKQTLSPDIKLSKELAGRDTKTPYFLDTIVWKIEGAIGPGISLTNFTNLKITGHIDFNILPSILIPTNYLKMPIVEFENILWKKYCAQKAGFLEVFTEYDKERSS